MVVHSLRLTLRVRNPLVNNHLPLHITAHHTCEASQPHRAGTGAIVVLVENSPIVENFIFNHEAEMRGIRRSSDEVLRRFST